MPTQQKSQERERKEMGGSSSQLLPMHQPLSPALYLPPLVSLSAIYELLPFPPSVRLADRPSSPPKSKVMHVLEPASIHVTADVENIIVIMMKEQLGRDGRL